MMVVKLSVAAGVNAVRRGARSEAATLMSSMLVTIDDRAALRRASRAERERLVGEQAAASAAADRA